MNIQKEARRLLMKNIRRTQEGMFILPDREKYKDAFLWDTGFAAIALSYFNPHLSEQLLATYLQQVAPSGRVPHIVFFSHSPLRHVYSFFYKAYGISRLTQPPVLSWAAEIVYRITKHRQWLKNIAAILDKYMEFLETRDVSGDKLIEIIHPWESGMDSSPIFDSQLSVKHMNAVQYRIKSFNLLLEHARLNWDLKRILKEGNFVAENVAFNAIYARALKSMRFIHRELGNNEKKNAYEELYYSVLKKLETKLWNKKQGMFFDSFAHHRHSVKVKACNSLIPLILQELSRNKVEALVEHLTNSKEFWPSYPVPSVALDEESFKANEEVLYWRGPTWININWVLYWGLKTHGFEQEARQLREKTTTLVQKNGFREFYNPLSGKGLGAKRFAWSTLVVDMV